MRTKIHVEDRDNIVLYSEDDVEEVLDLNKELRAERQRMDWGRHIASIPNIVLTKWLNEEHAKGNLQLRMGGEEWDRLIARKLADPDWKFLRTDK